MNDFEISGGTVTDEESAAIAAVVADVLAREAEVLAAPPQRPRQSDWVLAWRPNVRHVRTESVRSLAPPAEVDDDG